MIQHIVNCETGDVSLVPMTPDEIATIQAAQDDIAAQQQAAAQQAATLKAQTLAAFVAEYRNLVSIGASTFAAFGLYQSLRVAERDFGITVSPATDLPADLQAGLASLPA